MQSNAKGKIECSIEQINDCKRQKNRTTKPGNKSSVNVITGYRSNLRYKKLKKSVRKTRGNVSYFNQQILQLKNQKSKIIKYRIRNLQPCWNQAPKSGEMGSDPTTTHGRQRLERQRRQLRQGRRGNRH